MAAEGEQLDSLKETKREASEGLGSFGGFVPSPTAVAPSTPLQTNHVAESPPLSVSEVRQFVEEGYVLLKSAFSSEAASLARDQLWQCIAQDGIHRDDPTTWPTRRHGIAEVFASSSDAPSDHTGFKWGQPNPWVEVVTPRLRAAIDQLCGGRALHGPDDWGCGWWVVTFPTPKEEEGDSQGGSDDNRITSSDSHHWDVDGHWHVDGYGYRHFPNSPQIGVLPIFLFNDIGPEDGGTVLCPKSHIAVARLLWEKAGLEGMDGGELTRVARARLIGQDTGFPLSGRPIVEVNGVAGDVMLAHPFMLHARSLNLGRRGLDSVRFMCHPAVPLSHPMRVESPSLLNDVRISRVESKDHQSHTEAAIATSPVEEAIIIARKQVEVKQQKKKKYLELNPIQGQKKKRRRR